MYEEYLSHFNGEITKEIGDYVNNTVFEEARYIFTEKRKGQQYGYCTHCNKEFRTSGLKHKSYAKCPYCGGNHKVQSTAYKRSSLVHNASFVFFEKSTIDTSTILAVEYFVTRDFGSDYKRVRDLYTVLGLSIFEPGKSTMLKKNNWTATWEKRNSVFKVGRGQWFRRYDGYTSFESIENAVKGTQFQYSTWESYKEEDMLKFFELYTKYPCIEYLTKCGCNQIVKGKLNNYNTFGTVNWNGKNIFKVLKITKSEFKETKREGISITTEFLNSKKFLAGICNLNMQAINDYKMAVTNNLENLKKIGKIVNLNKVHKYLTKQVDGKEITSFYLAFTTFKDYIEDCINLEFNLNDEHVLFPRNIYKAHQNTIKQLKIKENKEFDERIGEMAKKYKKYCFEHKNIFIRPAESSKELIEEGQALHHCVANYSKRYAEDKTIILVIRKISEGNKPYCTMEISNNEIIQVRANYNKDPDQEAKEFIEEFKKIKLKNKRKKVA